MGTPFHCAPQGGDDELTGIVRADADRRIDARIANEIFLDRLRRYAEQHDARLLEAIRAAKIAELAVKEGR